MPQTAIIPTFTSISIIGTQISIKSQYVNVPPYTIIAFIADVDGTLDGVSYFQGDLIFSVMNYPGLAINFYLDSNGNLVVNSFDANHYSIDSNGQLTYT